MEKKESRGRTGRKPSSRIANFLHSEGRRWCAAALSLCLLLNSMVSVAWAVETENTVKTAGAEETEEILFPLTRNALYEALQEAVRKGNTVNKAFTFQGKAENVKAYETLFSFVDGEVLDEGLYELKPKFENEEEDGKAEDSEERDKEKKEELQLRIFVSLDGEVDPKQEYMLNGDEKVIFYLSNPSEKEQSAVIQNDEKKTEKITVIPRSDVIIDRKDELESDSEESVSGNLSGGSSGGTSVGGAGNAEKEAEQAVSESDTGNGSKEDMNVFEESGSKAEERQETDREQKTEESQTDKEQETKAEQEVDRKQDTEENQGLKETQEVEEEQETDKKQEGKETQESERNQEADEVQDTQGTQDVKETQSTEKTQEPENNRQEEGGSPASEEKKAEANKSEANQPDREKTDEDKPEKAQGESVKTEEAASKENHSQMTDSENQDTKPEGTGKSDTSEKSEKSEPEQPGNSDTKDSSNEGTEFSAVISRNTLRLVADSLEKVTYEEAENLEETSTSDVKRGGTAEEAGKAVNTPDAEKRKTTEETASPSDADVEEIIGELYEAVVVEEESVVLFVTTTGELGLNDAALRIASDSNAKRFSPAFEEEVVLENVIVQVKAEKNVLPEEAALQVRELKKDGEHAEQYEKAEEALKNQGKTYSGIMALDISFLDDTGNEIEPDGIVQVTFKQVKIETDEDAAADRESDEGEPTALSEEPLSEEVEKEGQEESAENIQVFHLDEEAIKVKEMKTQTEDNGDVVMETDHFSVYVLVVGDGVDAGNGFKVRFEHWMETGSTENGEKVYEKRYKDSFPVDDNGKPVNIGTQTGNAETIEVVKINENYDIDKIRICAWYDDPERNYDSDYLSQKEEEEAETTVVDGKERISITKDSVVRIYYRNNEGQYSDQVTFYDYAVRGSTSDGVTIKEGYSLDHFPWWVPAVVLDGEAGINHPANYGGSENEPRMVSGGALGAKKPLWIKVQDRVSNINVNDPTINTPIVPGIIKKLDTDGNPEFGTDQNGNQIYDPGYFTRESKIGKYIYAGDDIELDFERKGEWYKLKGAEVYGNYTNAGEDSITFFPLDKVPSAKEINDQYDLSATERDEDNYLGPQCFAQGAEVHNWYFGMRYEFEFTLGDYIGPLEYQFAGDDDLWVFLDDKLVLDLGGLHSAYPGRYEKKWRNNVNLWWFLNHPDAECSGYDNDPEADKSGWDPTKNYDTSKKYKVTVLYMERGGWDSTCAMEYIIPNIIPVKVEPAFPDAEKIKIPVTKIWNDEDNKAKNRPDEITLALYQKKKGTNEEWEKCGYPGSVITLNSSSIDGSSRPQNRWTGFFEILDSEWDKFDYKVFEMNGDNPIEANGYLPGRDPIKGSYQVMYSEPSKDFTVEITNTYNPAPADLSLIVKKILKDDINLYLDVDVENVEFKLVPLDQDGQEKTGDDDVQVRKIVADANSANKKEGSVSFNIAAIEGAKYHLYETVTVPGFKGLSGKIVIEVKKEAGEFKLTMSEDEQDKVNIQVSEDTFTITVTNQAMYTVALPDTGGEGIGLIKEYGWMLLLLALIMAGMEVSFYGGLKKRKAVLVQHEKLENKNDW